MRWQLLIPSMAILNPKIRGATQGRLAAAIFLSTAVGMVFADESRDPIFAGAPGRNFIVRKRNFNRTPTIPLPRGNLPARVMTSMISSRTTPGAPRWRSRASPPAASCSCANQNLPRAIITWPSNSANWQTPGEIWRPSRWSGKSSTSSNWRANWMNISITPGPRAVSAYCIVSAWLAGEHRQPTQSARMAGTGRQTGAQLPENQLNLVESRWQWNDRSRRQRELKTLDTLWPDAQKIFTGEAWEQSWNEWSTRRDAARKKLEESSAPSKPSKNSQ